MDYSLRDLIDIPQLAKLLDSLDAVQTMPSAIVDMEGNVLTATAWQDVCTKFHRAHSDTERQCRESDTYFANKLCDQGGHFIYKCPMGLVDTATPIIVEGKHIGNVFTGQLFLEPPNEEAFLDQARRYGFDPIAYLEAVRKVPVFTEQQLRKNLTFLHQLAEMLANEGLKKKRLVEAEEALREANRFNDQVIASANEGIIVYGTDLRYLVWNPFMEYISGMKASQVLGKHPEEVFPFLKDTGVIERLKGALTGAVQDPVDFPYYVPGTGKSGWTTDTSVPFRNATGEIIGVIGTVSDITGRKRAEDDLRFSKDLYATLSQTNHAIVRCESKAELFLEITRICSEYGHFELAWVGEPDETGERILVSAAHGPSTDYLVGIEISTLEKQATGRGPTGTCFREARVVVAQNWDTDSSIEPWKNIGIAHGFHSSAAFPISQDGQLIAVLTLYSNEVNFFLPARVQLLAEMANNLGHALEGLATEDLRVRVEEALGESEEKYRTLIENSQDLIYILTADGVFTYVSPAWTALLGHPVDQVVGQPFQPFVHPDDLALCLDWLKKVIETGQRQEGVAYRVRHLDRSWRWHTSSAVPIRDECGTVVGFQGTARDITERKQAQLLLAASEEKYRTLVDNLSSGIVVHRPDTSVLFSNPIASTILGLSKDQMSGKTAMDPCWRFIKEDGSTLPPEGYPVVRIITSGEGFQGQILGICRPDLKEPIWVFCDGYPVKDEQGVFLQAVISFVDITERKQAETLLRLSADDLRESQRFAKVGSWRLDLSTNRVVWSDELYRMCGLDPALPPPDYTEHQKLFTPESWNRLTTALAHTVETGIPYEVELETVREGQSNGWMWAYGKTALDANGITVGLFGVAQDITERKQAEAEIRSLNQNLERRVQERTAQLEDANQELEAFSYSVSHDLRAPLCGIDGFSQALVEDYQDRLDETGKKYLSRISIGTKRMGQIIDDLLKLSHVSRSELDLVEVNLTDLCQKVLEDLARVNPHQRVDVSIQPGLSTRADHRLLLMVLENLLRNAVKFTSKREEARIEVGELTSPSGEPAFFIRDNGAGFEMSNADKLFDAFQRLHTTDEFEGSGIGLAIVQRIISRHGGRIWAEAEPEKGATFFFTLPDRSRA